MRTYWGMILRDRVQTAQIKTKTLLNQTTNQVSQQICSLRNARLWRVGYRRFARLTDVTGRQFRRAVHGTQGLIVQATKRRVVEPFTGLILIAAFVVVGNQANQQALAAPTIWESDVAGLAAEEVSQVLAAIDPLTPELEEDPERVASLLVSSDDAYLTRPELAMMAEAETLSKKDPIPYVVQKGDTLVTIAQEHERTVATILDANDIKPEDAGKITPGVTLLIPQEDTSDSLAWLEADQRAKAEAARIAAAKAATARKRTVAAATTRERASAGYDGSAGGGFALPIRHNGITRGLSRGHAGIDYRADAGTPVAAAAAGRVIEITRGWAGGFGISVLVDHGGGRTSRYAHLSGTAVGIGQTVGQGDLVGYSGNTGRSTGSHLHFEVRVGGRAVNPF